MAITTTTSQIANLQKYMNKKTLENFKSSLYLYDMGEKSIWQDGAYTIQWLKFNKLQKSFNDALLSEGATPTETDFGATTVSVTPKQFGEYVTLSDMLLDTDPVSYIDGAIKEISDNMSKVVDDYIQETISIGTNVIYSGSATARNEVDKTVDRIKATDLNKARTMLEAANVPKVDGHYVAIMHPLVYHDLMIDNGVGNFIEISKYANPEKIFKGEVGSMFGIRIVVSSNIKYFSGEGEALGDVYPTYILGKQAYGVPTLEQLTTYITPRTATDSDPLAQRVKVGAKVAFGAKILHEEGIVRVESGASLA